MFLMNLKSLRLLIYLSGLISVFLIIYYIYLSNYNKNINRQNERQINFLMMQQQRTSNYLDGNGINPQMKQHQKEIINAINQMNGPINVEKYDERVVKNRVIREKVKFMSESMDHNHKSDLNSEIFSMDKDLLIYNKTLSHMHIFYYLPVKWYTPENQSIYQLNTVFYPKRGLYNYSMIESARKILKVHFEEIRMCGIGVIVVNWVPNNRELNDLLPLLFNIAGEINEHYQDSQVKIAIQIGNYQDRTIESIRNDIKFFVDNFTTNPNFFKVQSLKRSGRPLPLFYIKNAELIKDWSKLLTKNGILTIRDTNYNSFIIAHLE